MVNGNTYFKNSLTFKIRQINLKEDIKVKVKEVVSVVDTKIKPIIRRSKVVKGEVVYSELSYNENADLEVIDISIVDNRIAITI